MVRVTLPDGSVRSFEGSAVPVPDVLNSIGPRLAKDTVAVVFGGELHDVHQSLSGDGTFRALNPPFRMSNAEAAAKPFVAALGEQTEAVLSALGYTPGEIAAFAKSGITAAP